MLTVEGTGGHLVQSPHFMDILKLLQRARHFAFIISRHQQTDPVRQTAHLTEDDPEVQRVQVIGRDLESLQMTRVINMACIYLSVVLLSIYLPIIFLSIIYLLSMYLSSIYLCIYHLSVFIYLSIYLPICLPIYVSICVSIIYLLSIYLPISLPIYVSIMGGKRQIIAAPGGRRY